MHINRTLLLITLAAVILAACSGGGGVPDTLQDPDWCYVFDFKSSDYGASVSSGTWLNGVGFQTTLGELDISYTHNQIVEPGVVIAKIKATNANSSLFTANLFLFGIDESYSDTIPFDIDLELPLVPDVAGTGGTIANVEITSDAIITVESVEVRSFGNNPFPENDCQNEPVATPTVQSLPSLTPTSTATATSTATSTPTPTTTQTPEPGWCYEWDFRLTDGGWRNRADDARPYGVWESGTGWVSEVGLSDERLYIEREFPLSDITKITFFIDWIGNNGGPNDNFVIANFPAEITLENANPRAGNFVSQEMSPFVQANLIEQSWANDGIGDTLIITDARIRGLGVNPFGKDNCNEPTPTPTITLTPEQTYTPTATVTATSTATYEEQCYFVNYSFNDGANGWLTTADAIPGAVVVEDSELLEQNVTLPAGDYYFTIFAEVSDSSLTSSTSFDYTIINPDLTSVSDSFYVLTNQQFAQNGGIGAFQTPLTLTSGLHTFDIFPDLTGITDVRVLSVCLSQFDPTDPSDPESPVPDHGGGAGYGWQTCQDTITPPDNSNLGDWISYQINRVIQFISCNLITILNDIFGFIQAVFDWMQTALSDILEAIAAITIQLIADLENLLVNLFDFIIEIAVFIRDFFEQVFLIIGKIGSILWLYFILAGTYLTILGNLIGIIVTAYFTATPTPPPGLPDCITAPQDYGLCAIYWIAENTFLSGAIGSLIIPTAVIFVNMITFMYFIGRVKKIVIRIGALFK